ncbi:dihydrofolate synthetase isoform X1 [Iris pallida]|uniref:Dihydrofolate synthetase isoform X1 n=1 Tax=Iris pallida TaxID=29817 RepID=A0AAX6ENI1_IRIPA|nr:dihydrofolate synthetase isoform X1 [Iris pallida]
MTSVIHPSLLSGSHAPTRKMSCFAKVICSSRHLVRGKARAQALRLSRFCSSSIMSEDLKIGKFLDYVEKLKNYERTGVPTGAGTDSDDGFDLGRMRRLLQQLGNPHTHFQAVHIAGTKGKGSTAAFLSNILRKEGYSVGCYTSPHILTIRERLSFGRDGDPVSAEALMNHFHQVKGILDKSIELEDGALTHFEVFTALAFSLFSQEKVDVAVIEAGLGGARDATNVLSSCELTASVITSIGEEHLAALGGSLESIAVAKSGVIKHGRPVVIGGPFDLHIEHIIREKASLMNSPVVSACDPGIQSIVKHFGREDGKAYQTCDILINVREDLELFIDLTNIKLQMLGNHQLQNAVTATCTALCLRSQGWGISDESIRAGLERTWLLGRSQFLQDKEAEVLGVSGTSILVDGAHTEASAKALSDTLKRIHPDGMLAFVVAMANDKDHVAFARQLLSGRKPDIVLLTEVHIAGGRSRATPALTLKDSWVRCVLDLGLDILDLGTISKEKAAGHSPRSTAKKTIVLAICEDASVHEAVKVADSLLQSTDRNKSGLIVATGSLHVASSLLAYAAQC